MQYELNEKREGACKCGNILKSEVHWFYQIRISEAYCINCHTCTPIRFLKVVNN